MKFVIFTTKEKFVCETDKDLIALLSKYSYVDFTDELNNSNRMVLFRCHIIAIKEVSNG